MAPHPAPGRDRARAVVAVVPDREEAASARLAQADRGRRGPGPPGQPPEPSARPALARLRRRRGVPHPGLFRGLPGVGGGARPDARPPLAVERRLGDRPAWVWQGWPLERVPDTAGEVGGAFPKACVSRLPAWARQPRTIRR